MEIETSSAERSFLQLLGEPGQRDRVCKCGQQVHKVVLSARLQQAPARLFSLNEEDKNKKLHRAIQAMQHSAALKRETAERNGGDSAETVERQRS